MSGEMKPSEPLFIWLDDEIESTRQGLGMKNALTEIVKGHFQTFTSQNQCIDSITDDETKRIFLIVSNKLGHLNVPMIYQIPQIEKIYVFCRTRAFAEGWAKPELKVAGIYTQKKELLDRIREEMSACMTSESVPITVLNKEYTERSLKKLNDQDAKFMWYQALLKVLLLIANHCNAKEEMIRACRAKYDADQIEQRKIDDFEQNYIPSNAFWWYTYNSFVFRLLNQALRCQDTDVIFPFRFFIKDLDDQIKQHYMKFLQKQGNEPERLTFYRGQFMCMSEIDLLRNNPNQIIATNSFLSATVNRDVADIFAGQGKHPTDDSLHSVLFIIDACHFDQDTAAFAFIQKFSCSPQEEEVLFTINAIFRIEEVKHKDNIWNVYLRLEKRLDVLQKTLSDYMMQQLRSTPGPTSFGWFLYRIGDFAKAERYANYIITQFPPNNAEIGHANYLLGLIYKHKGRGSFEQSLAYFQKALDVYSRLNRSPANQTVAVHYNIALIYLEQDKDRDTADQQLKMQELINQPSNSIDPLVIALNDRIIGKLLAHDQNYPRAYEIFKSIYEKKRQVLPAYYQSFASTLNDMGLVQEKMDQNDLALANFQEALKITHISSGEDHVDLVECHTNIGRIYQKLGDYERALDEFRKALAILNQSSEEGSDTRMRLLTRIKEIEEKMQKKI